jgi:hypothetical protein
LLGDKNVRDSLRNLGNLGVTTLAITWSKIGAKKHLKLQSYSNNYKLSINAMKRVIFLILHPKWLLKRVI